MTHYARGAAPGGDWFRDKDGCLATTKLYDETRDYVIDFTDLLDSGETIASHTWEVSGPTITSVLATPIVTATVTGSGYATLELVTSTQVRRETYRWIGRDRGVRDYA